MLLLISIFKLLEVMILKSRKEMLFIIVDGIELISVEILLINLKYSVIIFVLLMIKMLKIFVIVSILMFLLYVVVGGLLINEVMIVVILFFIMEWCSFGFLMKFCLIILFSII